MALSNAERQARWRAKREAVAKHRAANRPLRNGQSFLILTTPPPPRGPKENRVTPPAMVKAGFDLKLSGCRVNIDDARKEIAPLVSTLSPNWTNGSVEEVLIIMGELKKLADLLRRTQ